MRARASRAATTSSCRGMQRWATLYIIKYKGCRQTGAGDAARHHLLVNCEAWKTHIPELWKDVGKRCGRKNRRTPRIALLFDDERATKAVLSFLRRTKVWRMVTIPPRDIELGEENEESGGEPGRGEGAEEGLEGGTRPPIAILQVRFLDQGVRCGCASFSICLSFASGEIGERRLGCPTLTTGPRTTVWGPCWMETGFGETPVTVMAQPG